MKKLLVTGLFSLVILLAACKKDSPNSTSNIEGTYNLKYISVKSNSTVIGSSGDKAVTISEYSTTDNTGTISFSEGVLSTQDVTYVVNTQAKVYVYDGSDLLDSLSFPFNYTIPPLNSVLQYKIIGADSIYLTQGGLTSTIGGTGSYQTMASGGHYSFSGNLLTITQNLEKDSTFQDSGETYQMIEKAAASLVLEKK